MLKEDLNQKENTSEDDNMGEEFDFGEIKPAQLTQNEQNYLYNLGAKHFKVQDYDNALAIFQLLASCKSDNPLYMKSLAGCLQAKQEFEGAIISYKFAFILNPEENIDCLFYSGVCLYELGRLERARTEFKAYINSLKPDEAMSKRAQFYLEGIERKLAQGHQDPEKEPQHEQTQKNDKA